MRREPFSRHVAAMLWGTAVALHGIANCVAETGDRISWWGVRPRLEKRFRDQTAAWKRAEEEAPF